MKSRYLKPLDPGCLKSGFDQHFKCYAWVAQSVGHSTLGLVLISWILRSSPASGSALSEESA